MDAFGLGSLLSFVSLCGIHVFYFMSAAAQCVFWTLFHNSSILVTDNEIPWLYHHDVYVNLDEFGSPVLCSCLFPLFGIYDTSRFERRECQIEIRQYIPKSSNG